MAGVLTPQTGFELVSKMKDAIDLPLEVHTHATSGISEMTYLKVAEAVRISSIQLSLLSAAVRVNQPQNL